MLKNWRAWFAKSRAPDLCGRVIIFRGRFRYSPTNWFCKLARGSFSWTNSTRTPVSRAGNQIQTQTDSLIIPSGRFVHYKLYGPNFWLLRERINTPCIHLIYYWGKPERASHRREVHVHARILYTCNYYYT